MGFALRRVWYDLSILRADGKEAMVCSGPATTQPTRVAREVAHVDAADRLDDAGQKLDSKIRLYIISLGDTQTSWEGCANLRAAKDGPEKSVSL